MKDYKKMVEEIMENLGKFSKETPEQMEAFHNFMEASEKPGALDKKTKELIALGISIKAQCEYCIAFHTKGALDAGATKEEIMETIWVTVLMGGGPSLMYAQAALKAIDDLS
jgi:AhpD family alkylhydroperoxidase